jgi:hypothetical protein
MALTWMTGLYGPLRDIVLALAGRRRPRLGLTIEAVHLGKNTRVVVTAKCESGKPVIVRGCFAELYVSAYDSCVEPRPVRTRTVRFAPNGTVGISPGDSPVGWEAQIADDQIRRVSREQDAAETLEAYGERASKVLAEQHESEREAWVNRETCAQRLGHTLGGPEGVRIRAVIDTADGRNIATAPISVPPSAPIKERLIEAAVLIHRTIRSRSGHGPDGAAGLPPGI